MILKAGTARQIFCPDLQSGQVTASCRKSVDFHRKCSDFDSNQPEENKHV